MHKAIEVLWRAGNAKGYRDVFPAEQFAQDVSGAERLHEVRGPHGGVYHARYLLAAAAKTATLDYTPFPEFNSLQGMELGVMALGFADSGRTHVTAVRWNGKLLGSKDVTVATKAVKEPPALGELIAKQQHAFALQMLRPGQAEFRKRLDLVYGARCCVSGCPVPWALEAAHIVPFADDVSSNSPSNGLLLRADLHALFDSHQMAIHPNTRIVFFGTEAKLWGDYSLLQGKAMLAKPQPGSAHHAPTANALVKRWKKFVDTHGSPD